VKALLRGGPRDGLWINIKTASDTICVAAPGTPPGVIALTDYYRRSVAWGYGPGGQVAYWAYDYEGRS
jgi:hypothetical protein